MSTELSGLIPLSEIVFNVLNDIQDYSMNQYKRYMQWLIRDVTDMKLNISQNSVKVVYLTMGEDKTADLPEDFIDYSKIAVRYQGKLWTLTRRDEIIKPQTVVNGEPVLDTQYGEGLDIDGSVSAELVAFAPHWYNGYYVQAQYAIPGGFNACYYTIDKAGRRIVFNGTVPRGEVVLEYISSGLSTEGENYVGRDCLEYLLASLHYKRLKFSNTSTQYEIEIARRDLGLMEQRLIARENSLTIDEFKDAIKRHYKQVKV